MRRTISALITITLATMLVACASQGAKTMDKPFAPLALPAAVQVPAGHAVAMGILGVGNITYECKLKANTTDQYDWTFAGPDAKLMDRSGKTIGKYFGPPATWQSNDGSKVTDCSWPCRQRSRVPLRCSWSKLILPRETA
jgi:hypothetical protein